MVTFICNHCPYVKHVAAGLAELGRDMPRTASRWSASPATTSPTYPQDGPAQMAQEADRHGWTFPYLFDETQDVARAYSAACTPDTFVFDGERRLVYRGQLDDSRPRNSLPVTGADVRAAVDAVLAGGPSTADQSPRWAAASSGAERGAQGEAGDPRPHLGGVGVHREVAGVGDLGELDAVPGQGSGR